MCDADVEVGTGSVIWPRSSVGHTVSRKVQLAGSVYSILEKPYKLYCATEQGFEKSQNISFWLMAPLDVILLVQTSFPSSSYSFISVLLMILMHVYLLQNVMLIFVIVGSLVFSSNKMFYQWRVWNLP